MNGATSPTGSRAQGQRARRARPWRDRPPRGATAVLVAICLVVLCGFLALALNAGHLFSVKGELQNAADSAALAGAQSLDGTMAPITSEVAPEGAVATGNFFAGRHDTDSGTDVTTQEGDVQIGFWDVEKKQFTSYTAASVDPDLASCRTASTTSPCINAVRARTHRDANHSGSVPIAFGALLGTLTSNVGAEAIAVTGGPCGMKCIGLPIVLPDCGVDPFLGPPCVGGKYKVAFKSALTDTGAWADLGSGASTVKCLLKESLVQTNTQSCAADTACTVDTSLAVTGDVGVINGQINSACDLITRLYAAAPNNKYVIPIVDAQCTPKEQWVQDWNIVKFATIKISWAPPDCNGTNNAFFEVEVLCDETTNNASSGGCAAAGTWVRPGLVR